MSTYALIQCKKVQHWVFHNEARLVFESFSFEVSLPSDRQR